MDWLIWFVFFMFGVILGVNYHEKLVEIWDLLKQLFSGNKKNDPKTE